MADQDDFEIDIYGDDDQDMVRDPEEQNTTQPLQHANVSEIHVTGLDGVDERAIGAQIEMHDSGIADIVNDEAPSLETNQTSMPPQQKFSTNERRQSTTPSTQTLQQNDSMSQTSQVDTNATSALRLSELQWWHSEDDVRAWANKSQVEAELKDVTFNEFKVNGKSKGSAQLMLAE